MTELVATLAKTAHLDPESCTEYCVVLALTCHGSNSSGARPSPIFLYHEHVEDPTSIADLLEF